MEISNSNLHFSKDASSIEAPHDATKADSTYRGAVCLHPKLNHGKTAPKKEHEEELERFLAYFSSIRFDKKAVLKLCSEPLHEASLERRLIGSGACEINPDTRKRYVEWLFSSREDCTKWLAKIPEHLTFKTKVFSLTYEEGAAIVEAYRMKALGGKKISTTSTQILRKLAQKIDHIKQTEFKKDQKIFVRLDPRSPKDGVMYPGCSRYDWLLKEVTEQAKVISKQMCPENEKKHRQQVMLASLAIEALALDTGDDAVEVLTNSERTLRDIQQAAEFPKLWDMKGVIRAFEKIPYHNEFRVFIYQGTLTAISQYDHRLYFPELSTPSTLDRIRSQITSFFNLEIKDLMGNKSYILDLGILDKNTIKVIELNPFEPTTGPGLFSWEKELNVLTDRSSPVPFRVVESAHSPPERTFPEWEEVLSV